MDLSTKHKAVTEYLLHVSSKRNFHALDNRLEANIEVTRVDDREDGAESLDKMLTLLTTTIKTG